MRYLTLALVLLLAACSHGKNIAPDAPSPAVYDQLVIVGTNDFHGYLRPVESPLGNEKVTFGGAEWFAGYINILERKFGDRLILLDGGDMFQGTMESNLFQGKSVVDYYNLLPYRAVAVGNHEFDYGPAQKGHPDRLGALKERMRQANFPFVQANIYLKGTDKVWHEENMSPSVLVTAGGYQVGIIGLTTMTTPAKTLPMNVQTLEFRDFVAPTLREAKRLRDLGAEFIVITTHEGDLEHTKPIREFINRLPKGTVDAIVTGHAHSEIHEMIEGVPVIQSKTRGLYFGRIDLFVNKATRKIEPTLTKIHDMHWVCGNFFKKEEDCDQKRAKDLIAAGKADLDYFLPLRPATYEGEEVKPDLRVREVLAPYFAKADGQRKEVLGEALADFDWYPSGENQMGTLFMDAFHERFPNSKVIYLNGGGFRRRFFRGPLTYGDLYEVSPFDNFVVELKINGKQLKDLMRVGVSGSQTIPAIRGVRVTYIDSNDPAFERDINGDGKKDKWERDRLAPQIGVVWEPSNRPVKDNEEFWIATNDYLAEGGDNCAHVFGSVKGARRKYSDATQRDVVAEYLRKHPKLSLPKREDMRVRVLN